MIALLAPLVVQAAASGFVPPLDRPLAYSVSEVRQEAAETSRFTIERRVTFHAAPDGFTAEVETLSVTGDAGRAGRLFEAMARSMLGRRVVLTLDRTGKATDVADLDTLWAAQLAAMTDTLTSKDPAREAAFTTLLAPMRSLPRAAKVARIADMIAPLVANDAVVPIAAHAITLPARGQDGTQALLTGTERVVATPNGLLLFERHANGVVSGAATTISQRRRIDPRTRLVTETVNISTVETTGARLIVTRSTTIKP